MLTRVYANFLMSSRRRRQLIRIVSPFCPSQILIQRLPREQKLGDPVAAMP